MCFFKQATFKGWSDITNHAIDSKEVFTFTVPLPLPYLYLYLYLTFILSLRCPYLYLTFPLPHLYHRPTFTSTLSLPFILYLSEYAQHQS